MPTIFWVALGGALGATSRWLVGLSISKLLGEAWPYATWFINVSGCFVLGMVLEFSHDKNWQIGHRYALWIVGFLGAFTTFSTFAAETHALMRRESMLASAAYVAASVFAGFLAFAFGRLLLRAA